MGLSCFVVRPFGKRQFKSTAGDMREVDFQRVHDELIAPAIKLAGLDGNTTEDIAYAGNIREDMFTLLAHADVVVADISLHNANVFYELGARHALRKRRTFLIRFAADEVPFDLKTDRYLGYDATDPASSVRALAEGLRATIANDTSVDSPIFNLLPALKAPDVADLVPVPQDFQDEVAHAQARGGLGHLLLLASEADRLPWGTEGMRLVGRALVEIEAWTTARSAWEQVRTRSDGDLEADIRLATICQRLDDLTASDQAIARVLVRKDLSARDRAEAHGLAASNAQQRWCNAWSALPAEQTALAARRALNSQFLKAAQSAYAKGFSADLNHFYCGVNAMAMARIRLDIGEAHPQQWQASFDDDDEAAAELKHLRAELADLAGAVHWSVLREINQHAVGSEAARWALCSKANLQLLRKASPTRVSAAFEEALEGAPPQVFGAVRQQLALYRRLGLFADHLALLDALVPELEAASQHSASSHAGLEPRFSTQQRVLVFSGHRVDAPAREKQRFPPSCEGLAMDAINAAIDKALGDVPPEQALGIAGGANGGDILFHECCARRGIPSALKLAIPVPDYIVHSVAISGQPGWIERFHAIRQRCEAKGMVAQLCHADALPRWLAKARSYDLWERNNRWTLLSALARGADKVRLIVLWDGLSGDGPGGTQHMVHSANAAGAEVINLDTRTLFAVALAP